MESKPKSNDEKASRNGPPETPPINPSIDDVARKETGKARNTQRGKTEHQINEATMAVWTRRVGVFTGALAASTVITTIIIACQLNVMRSTDEAIRIAVEGSRAWVAPQNAILLDDLKAGEPFRFQIEYHNVGREPALDVNPTYRLESISEKLFADNTFNSAIESHHICDGVKVAPGADVLYPAQTDGYKLVLGVPKGWMSADIVDGKSAMVVHMCIAYTTGKAVHHTAFCFFYRPGVSENKQFNVCTAGNYAD